MKRMLCMALGLCLLAGTALAQPAGEAQAITGEVFYPDGADAQTAACVLRYAFPQFEVQSPADEAINAYYRALVEDWTGTAIPQTLEGLDALPAPGDPPYAITLGYRVTLRSADYASVLLTSQQFLGNTQTESWSATVFARSGVYAGQPVSLSQAMGLEQDDGTAPAAQSYAATLVYGLVWQIITEQRALQQVDSFPELTREALEQAFSPESDFYLDESGNFVFYIQAGEIASEVEGVLTYPFSMAELLSAVTP